MHAGSVRIDTSLSRRSFVTHDFAEGCVVFHDYTGMLGMLAPRDAASVGG
jgi:hypothetical protein